MSVQLDSLWRALDALERRQRAALRGLPLHRSDWFDDLQARRGRVQRLHGALFLSGPTALRILAERLPGIDLAAIGEVLLSACKDIALVWGGSVLLGGAAGAAVGALAGGVGAVPGAVAGAVLGLQASTWVLGVLGLKALVEDLATAIPQALAHYERGIRMAWGPVQRWEGPDGLDRAHYELAEGHIILMMAILAALAAYLTRGRGDPAARARILAEVSQSPRLGPKVADWLAANEERLTAHPALKPKQQQVQMASAAKETGPPMTPAQVRRLKEQAEPPSTPPPKPPQPTPPRRLPPQQVPCFHPYDKANFKGMSPPQQREYLEEMAKQLRRQEDFINSMPAAEFKAAREAYATKGRNPAAALSQQASGNNLADDILKSIGRSLERSQPGMKSFEVEQLAAQRTEQLMEKLAALHEPDMVAGGWLKPEADRMGRADVNKSIGGSWNQQGRLAAMDGAADEAIRAGNANATMNVKLEVCRGKGLR